MDENRIQQLLAALRSSSEERALEATRELGSERCAAAVPDLLATIETTESRTLRNQLALALADIGDVRAASVLAALLADPRTAGSRGTLLHALSFFDCTPHFELLVDLVITGAFEARHEAFSAIESITTDVSEDIRDACVKRVRAALRKSPIERKALLLDLIEVLDDWDDDDDDKDDL